LDAPHRINAEDGSGESGNSISARRRDPVVGDWNGDGIDEIGIFYKGSGS